MTPAEKAGFIVGQKYVTTRQGIWGSAGQVLTFLKDDGTSIPCFGPYVWIPLNALRPYKEGE